MIDRIRTAIADTFDLNLDDVTEDTSQGDINEWDSIGSVTLVVAIEQEFGVSISPETARRMTSVRAIVAELQDLMAKRVQ